MKFPSPHFNIILLLLALVAGCATTDDPKKKLTTIRFHTEADPVGGGFTLTAPIYRAHPINVNVERTPFTDERDVDSAVVADWMDGFAIQIHLNRHGQWLLENVTRSNPNHRIAVACQFDNETRWLAAPIIARPITDGTLAFTPDATHEEAERIVRGLNNVAADIKKKSKY